jgi:hypothetical protein
MQKINPATPGKSSEFLASPHDMSVSPSLGGHVGMSRSSGGSFSKNPSMSQGGPQPDADRYVKKYGPGKSGAVPKLGEEYEGSTGRSAQLLRDEEDPKDPRDDGWV